MNLNFKQLIPYYNKFLSFQGSISNRVSFIDFLRFQFIRNKNVYWPVNKLSEVTQPENIYVGIDSTPGTRPGCYIQGLGGIYIGDYVRVASNVGIISGNHDCYNHTIHINKEVIIGDYSWIGMNAVVLPGVVLGTRTIVGAGSVVTKSFPEGYCVIGGNPANIIRHLDKELFVKTRYRTEYYGFIPKVDFVVFAQKFLKDNKYYYRMIPDIDKQ